jgi:RNA polymerase subunit RPABC4/transcription elongation factor Spt4
MAIKSCKECKGQVSSKADKCPHCGAKQSKGSWIGTVALIVLGTIIVVNLATDKKPKSTPAQVWTREGQISQGFSGMDGSHRELTRKIKAALRDPNSYEHIETKYKDNGDNLTIVTSYRAKNGFGGMNSEMVVARASIDGKVIEIVSKQ